ncbi:MAG: secretion system protein, partial [Halorientalis sp.]
MATDDKEGGGSDAEEVLARVERATVGEYTWEDLRREFHTGGPFDRTEFLGFDPREMEDRLVEGATAAKTLQEPLDARMDPEETGVRKGHYSWKHFKQEYYYDSDRNAPTDSSGEKKPFDASEYLEFPAEATEGVLSNAGNIADELAEVVDTRTVDVTEDLDVDDFFSDAH